MGNIKLVTGGSGFFGFHLVKELLKQGDSVRVLDIEALDTQEIDSPVDYIHGDIRDIEVVESACQGVDTVFHNVAALPISRAGKKFWDVNVKGTENVLQTALNLRIPKVIHISTSAVYGIPKKVPIHEETPLTPLGDYGQSKYEAEELCQQFKKRGLDISIVRPRTIVGLGRLGILQILFDWIKRGKNIYIIGTGDNLFQLLSASDLADACSLIGRKRVKNEDFNIGTDQFSTVRDVLETLIAHAGSKSRIISINPFLTKAGLFIVDKLHLSPLVSWHYLTPDKPFYFDIGKAKRLLDWNPRDSNDKMLCETYDWYLRNWQQLDKQFGVTHRKSVRQKILKLIRDIS